MASQAEPTIDLDQCRMVVDCIRSYYDFLISLYLPQSALKVPPIGGWPEITSDSMTFLGKTPQVLEILRHLPFISYRAGNQDQYQIYEMAVPIDYTGPEIQDSAGKPWTGPVHPAEPYSDYTTLPPEVFCIAHSLSRYGHWIFIDTKRWVGVLVDFFDGPRWRTKLAEAVDDSEDDWREGPTYKIEDFFEVLKKQFRKSQVVPVWHTEVSFPGEPRCRRAKKIYRKHGWPDNYDKEACMTDIEHAWEHRDDRDEPDYQAGSSEEEDTEDEESWDEKSEDQGSEDDSSQSGDSEASDTGVGE